MLGVWHIVMYGTGLFNGNSFFSPPLFTAYYWTFVWKQRLNGGEQEQKGGRTGSEFLSKHSARGFVFIAPLLLLISLRRVLMLWGGGLGLANGEVTELQALTRSDTGSRSAKHPPDFNGSPTFPVSALDQRSLPANQNTRMYALLFSSSSFSVRCRVLDELCQQIKN